MRIAALPFIKKTETVKNLSHNTTYTQNRPFSYGDSAPPPAAQLYI
jgi:hypothetical protein